METEKKYDEIEQYLSGDLKDEALKDFEAKIKNDQSLQKEIDVHRMAAETLKGEKVHQLRNTLNEVDANWNANENKTSKIIPINFRRIAAVAAVALLGILAYQLWMPSSTVDLASLYDDNFETYAMVLNERSGETDETNVLLNEAMKAYQEKDFRSAQGKFAALNEIELDNIAYQFYESLSLLGANQSDKAIIEFKKILTQSNHLFLEQSRWYLGLAYLQNSDKEIAKSTFENIQEGQYKYQEAQAILKDLPEN